MGKQVVFKQLMSMGDGDRAALYALTETGEVYKMAYEPNDRTLGCSQVWKPCNWRVLDNANG